MKRDEWYNSVKFLKLRLLGNVASEIHHKTQYLYDILNIILGDMPDLFVSDRFNMVERQIRVLQLEAQRLVSETNSLTFTLSPHKFDEETNESNGPDNKQGESSVES